MEKSHMILCLFIYFGSSVYSTETEYTLKSISVILRHGDRTPEPEPIGFYPNDPYRNHTFDPIGHGGLTNDGKRRAHEFGTLLRSRYDKFLGDIYRPSEVKVMSTDYDRTMMTLLSVLAGLFRPKAIQKWNNDLDWQPISINSIPNELGTFSRATKCPIYEAELRRVLNSTEYKKELSKFGDLMKNLTIFMGREVDSTEIIYHLYHTLTAEQSMNLTLPEWTRDYFPNGSVIDATLFEYKTRSYTQYLSKLNGGMFVKKILDDTVFIENEKLPKIRLYSVHENKLAAAMQVLNLWKNVIPEYSSALIFELYEMNSEYYFKILYYKGIPAEFEDQTIPGCSEHCSLDNVLNFTKDYLPDDNLIACFGPPNDSHLIPKSMDPKVWIYEKMREWYGI